MLPGARRDAAGSAGVVRRAGAPRTDLRVAAGSAVLVRDVRTGTASQPPGLSAPALVSSGPPPAPRPPAASSAADLGAGGRPSWRRSARSPAAACGSSPGAGAAARRRPGRRAPRSPVPPGGRSPGSGSRAASSSISAKTWPTPLSASQSPTPAQPRGVDEDPAAGQREQVAGGRGVPALAVDVPDGLDVHDVRRRAARWRGSTCPRRTARAARTCRRRRTAASTSRPSPVGGADGQHRHAGRGGLDVLRPGAPGSPGRAPGRPW